MSAILDTRKRCWDDRNDAERWKSPSFTRFDPGQAPIKPSKMTKPRVAGKRNRSILVHCVCVGDMVAIGRVPSCIAY